MSLESGEKGWVRVSGEAEEGTLYNIYHPLRRELARRI